MDTWPLDTYYLPVGCVPASFDTEWFLFIFVPSETSLNLKLAGRETTMRRSVPLLVLLDRIVSVRVTCDVLVLCNNNNNNIII